MPTLTELYNAYRRANGPNGRLLSHREAARRGGDPGRYETFRKIGTGQHGGDLEEATVRALVKLGLKETDVRLAAGHQISRVQDPFVLPPEADRLTRPQRETVLSVVDAILTAAEDAIAADRKRRERTPLRAVASGQRNTEAQREASEKARRRRKEMEKDE